MLRTAILAAILVATGTISGAQDLRNDLIDIGPPAEFPPADYADRQYVDSRGCVYVRVGAIGEPSWVPRVTGQRKVLCGFRPTQIARATPPVIPDPVPEPTPRVAAASAPTVAAPAPRVAAAAPAAQTEPRRTASATLTPKPYRAARNVSAAELAAEPVQQTRLGRRTVASKPRTVATKPRRAQAQSTAPVVASAPAASTRAGVSAPDTNAALVPGERIAVRAAPAIRTPPGYRQAWDDGRLNPDRGKQTLRGALQTALFWTQTVPRRLKTAEGRDVTNTYHYLVYPYTDYDKQLRDLRGGKFITVKTNQGLQIVPTASLKKTPSGKTVLSSKSGPPPEAATVPGRQQAASAPQRPRATGSRYVQVGTFGDAANAQSTARALRAAGLPVRLSPFTKRGTRYNVVLAGPFGDATGVRRGLQVVRSKGFSDAFVR